MRAVLHRDRIPAARQLAAMVADPERFAASAARTADRADRAVRRPAGGGASRRRAAPGSETVERADVRCGAGLAAQARPFRPWWHASGRAACGERVGQEW